MDNKDPLLKRDRNVRGRDLTGGYSQREPIPRSQRGGKINVRKRGSTKLEINSFSLFLMFFMMAAYIAISIVLFFQGLIFLTALLIMVPIFLALIFLVIRAKL